MTGPKLPITRPAMPSVTLPPRTRTHGDCEREIDALRMRSEQLEMRVQYLESAQSSARRGDAAQDEKHAEQAAQHAALCARLDAMTAAQGEAQGDARAIFVETTKAVAEVRSAIARTPWAVALGAGIVSALLGSAGSYTATKNVARETAAEMQAQPISEIVIVGEPPAAAASDDVDAGGFDHE